MNKRTFASVVIGLTLPFSAQADSPNVAVDIAPLHSLVTQVMQGVGEPDLIIPAEASPHEYSLRPSQARALAEADLVFWMGKDLTPWLEKALNNVSDSAQKIAFVQHESTTTYPYREGATFEAHEHHESEEHHDPEKNNEKEDHHDHHDDHQDHADHHPHDGIDPHAWLDPDNAKKWLTVIQTALSERDPENAKLYASNASQAIVELDKLIQDTQKTLQSLGKINFIVFHDAYQYFEKRFGVLAAGAISLGDAQDPSPARIKEIQQTVEKLGVSCVFTEPQYNPGMVKNVFAGKDQINIGLMDPLGAQLQIGNEHYSQLIQAMVSSLSRCGA